MESVGMHAHTLNSWNTTIKCSIGSAPTPKPTNAHTKHATVPYVQQSMPAVSLQTVTPKGCACAALATNHDTNSSCRSPRKVTAAPKRLSTTTAGHGVFFSKKMNLLEIVCATTAQTNVSSTPKLLCVCVVIRNPMLLVFYPPDDEKYGPGDKIFHLSAKF